MYIASIKSSLAPKKLTPPFGFQIFSRSTPFSGAGSMWFTHGSAIFALALTVRIAGAAPSLGANIGAAGI